MTMSVNVQIVSGGTAKCILIVGPRRIPFEVDCCAPLSHPIDREQFTQRLKDAAEKALRREHQDGHHGRLIGLYTIDLDPPDDTPPRPPLVYRSGETITAEVFGNTHHVLLRFNGREITAHPNKQRNISVAGIEGPVDVIPVSRDGVPGTTVRVP